MLHELTHWTGHSTRLDRKLIGRFGGNAYAFEELIAETGAAFLCSMLGLEKQPTPDHAKYLNNWLEVLKQDKRAMIKAFGQAQKAADYILASDSLAVAAE
jgi:antirestriction protein ArdC